VNGHKEFSSDALWEFGSPVLSLGVREFFIGNLFTK
jgi:hypothetical protein